MIRPDGFVPQSKIEHAEDFLDSVHNEEAKFNTNISKLADEKPKVKILTTLFKSAEAIKLTSFANYINSAKQNAHSEATIKIRGKPANEATVKWLDASYKAAHNNILAANTENQFKAMGFGNGPRNLQARNVQNGPPPTETQRKEKNRLNESRSSENNERIPSDNQSKEKNRLNIVRQDSKNSENKSAPSSTIVTPRAPIEISDLRELLKATNFTLEWAKKKLNQNPTSRQQIEIIGEQYSVYLKNDGQLYLESEKLDDSGVPVIDHIFNNEEEFIKHIEDKCVKFMANTEDPEINDYNNQMRNNPEDLENNLINDFSQHPNNEALDKVFAPDDPEADLELLLETLNTPTDLNKNILTTDQALSEFSLTENNNNAGVQQATENNYATEHAEIDKLLSGGDQHIKPENLDKAAEDAMQSLTESNGVDNQNPNQAFDINSGKWVSLHENIESVSTNILHPIK